MWCNLNSYHNCNHLQKIVSSSLFSFLLKNPAWNFSAATIQSEAEEAAVNTIAVEWSVIQPAVRQQGEAEGQNLLLSVLSDKGRSL